MSPCILAIGLAASVLAANGAVAADEPVNFEARYTLSLANIPFGKIDWHASISPQLYSATASGRASGLAAILVKGEGSIAVQGAVADGRLFPTNWISRTSGDDGVVSIKMTFERGNAKITSFDGPPPENDRVPVTEADREGVADPVSSLMIAAGAGEAVSPEICRRELSVFDGRRRYDLKLSFKRLDTIKVERGYHGPVGVCALAFRPISGHRSSGLLVKYLADGRDMELWLAPIAGTRTLAPVRFSIANLLGNLVIEADRFESATTRGAANSRP